MDFRNRQQVFGRVLIERDLDGFVVTHSASLRYLSGFTGSSGLLLFLTAIPRSGGRSERNLGANLRPVFFTDGRYIQQAREEVRGARIVIAKGPLLQEAVKHIAERASVAIGFEADHTTAAAATEMRKLVRGKISWKPTTGLIMRQRLVKDSDELRVIREAVDVGAAVYQVALQSIRPGVRESEVAGRLEFAARQAGADGMSFDTIVAAGKRAALPHGRASSQSMPRRGFVVVDSGVILRGYCSDMTRTVHLGRVNREGRKWYDAVLEAQLAGIAAVKPGKMAGEVDHAARQVLRKAKLERFFTHSTGHGVGLEIHEPPRLGKAQEEYLQAGMVITIEPGVYIPGKGGIRIEDMVLVTATGCEVLTPVTKELVEI